MLTKLIEYQDNGQNFEGYLAFDEKKSGPLPTVLIGHAWAGRDDFVCQKAEMLARSGYAAFAWDLFGKGVLGRNNEENAALIKPFMEDRSLLNKRLQTILTTAKKLEVVDNNRIAGIGFCFGGLCMLDLARSGVDLAGVISFHGLLMPPENLPTQKIQAKILVLHGHDDPMAPPSQVLAFQEEMTKANADWQTHIYGNTMHAFTKPSADDPEIGLRYNPLSDQRSHEAMQNFLKEIF